MNGMLKSNCSSELNLIIEQMGVEDQGDNQLNAIKEEESQSSNSLS
jgi:hypothetical protein